MNSKTRGFLAAMLLVASASAQAALTSLNEGFDDISTLAGAGWVLTNNSSPTGTTGWFQGNPGVFAAYDGNSDAYIAANFLNAAASGGAISNWLITPELLLPAFAPGQFRFQTRSSGVFPDYLEIYFSSSSVLGGASTDVGSTSTSWGDFHYVGTIGPSTPYPIDDWQGYLVTANWATDTYLRFAFRYVVADTFDEGDYIGIDRVQWSSTAPVPLPASFGLLWLGLGFLGALSRRGRQSAAAQ